MTTATRDSKYTKTTSGKSQVLYTAFELGVEEWKIGFTKDLGTKPRVRVMRARDLKQLAREITAAKQWFALPPNAAVRSCYEAGRDGFWLHRHLVTVGIDNRLIDSASIEVNRRQRRAKSDGLDARKLLGMLLRYHAGESKVWSVVRVPTVDEEDQRQLHRELRTLKNERTRVVNRMQGLLANQGLQLPKGRDVGNLLEKMRLWDGSPVPAGLRARLQREWEHAEFLQAKILELQRQRSRAIKHDRGEAIDKVRQLLQLRGIGENGAWVYVNEFFGWRQFNNRKEVGAAAGLVPTPYQSGDGHHEQGISKAGNRHIRAVAIEMAWSWLRYQPGSQLSRRVILPMLQGLRNQTEIAGICTVKRKFRSPPVTLAAKNGFERRERSGHGAPALFNVIVRPGREGLMPLNAFPSASGSAFGTSMEDSIMKRKKRAPSTRGTSTPRALQAGA